MKNVALLERWYILEIAENGILQTDHHGFAATVNTPALYRETINML
jgi:hypothetical protein